MAESRPRAVSQPGELNQRISIERASTSPDGAGGQSVAWEAVYSGGLWAKVQPVRGREEQRLGRLVTVDTYLVFVRFYIDITTLDRIVWREKIMNIRSVQDREGERKFWTCECEAGVPT